jgi:hypothetical protein
MRLAMPQAWRPEISWVENGLQRIRLHQTIRQGTQDEALINVKRAMNHLRNFVESEFPEVIREYPIIDHFMVAHPPCWIDPDLDIAFRVKNAERSFDRISRTLWEAAINSQLSETEALLVLKDHHDIPADVTADAIIIDEITVPSRKFGEPDEPYANRKTQPIAADDKIEEARVLPKDHDVGKDPALFTTATVLYRIDQDQCDPLHPAIADEQWKDIMEYAPKGWEIDLWPAMHDFQVITLHRKEEAIKDNQISHAPNDAEDAANTLRELIADLAKEFRDKSEKVEETIIRTSTEEDQTLYVNFRYNETNQICTATVQRSDWDAFTKHLSDEEALLLLAGEIEIDPDYTAGEITVDDVMTNFELYTG